MSDHLDRPWKPMPVRRVKAEIAGVGGERCEADLAVKILEPVGSRPKP